MAPEPTVSIVPLICMTSSGGCYPNDWIIDNAPVLAVLVGGLIMARWRELLLVAAVGEVVAFVGSLFREYALLGYVQTSPIRILEDWKGLVLVYAYMLVIAATAYAAKLLVFWILQRIGVVRASA